MFLGLQRTRDKIKPLLGQQHHQSKQMGRNSIIDTDLKSVMKKVMKFFKMMILNVWEGFE